MFSCFWCCFFNWKDTNFNYRRNHDSRSTSTQQNLNHVPPPFSFFSLCSCLSQVSQIISGLCWLYRLNMKLCSELHVGKCSHTNMHTHTHTPTDYLTDNLCVQSQGLWQLYSDMELNMIPVLAGEHCFTFFPPDTQNCFKIQRNLLTDSSTHTLWDLLWKISLNKQSKSM